MWRPYGTHEVSGAGKRKTEIQILGLDSKKYQKLLDKKILNFS